MVLTAQLDVHLRVRHIARLTVRPVIAILDHLVVISTVMNDIRVRQDHLVFTNWTLDLMRPILITVSR